MLKQIGPRANVGLTTCGLASSPVLENQSNTETGLLATAFFWLSLGAALVPLQPGSKHIVRTFGAHGAQILTPLAARAWFGLKRCNLGIVLGGLPGLVCLDFDRADLYEAWRAGPGAGVTTRTERTANGYHVFFTATRLPPGQPVAGLEVKTAGVVTAAPSVHPSGAVYQVICAGPISSLRPEHLTPPFFSLSSTAIIERRRPQARPTGTDLVTRIKQARPIADEMARLFPHVQLSGGGRWRHGPCPFHEDRRASFWIDTERNTWGCLAASCPQNGTHDVINLIALQAGLSVSEAIKQLVQEA